MDFNDRNILFLLIICCISLEGCAGKVFVPQEVTLWVEERSATLSCQVRDSTPSTVTWRIGIDGPLATWNEAGISLPNPNGKYNMTSDGLGNFDLIIKNISLSDAQSYTCAASEGVGNVQYNTSQVTVYDEPTKPYVMIDGCNGENDDKDDCHFDVFNETETRNLTCRVRHFFPNVTIFWSLRGADVEPLDVEWHLNEDGAYCGAVTITTSPQDEAYVCTATGEALRDVRTMSVRAVVQLYQASTPTYTTEESGDGDGGGGGNAANIGLIVGIVIAVLFILMFVLFILYVVWVKKREGRGNFNYKYTKQKAGGTVAEDDEKRAGASKTKTEEGSKPEEQDNFRLEVEELEDNKKSGKSKDEDTFDKSEKSPVDDAGDRGGHGGGHGDHHDLSSSGGGGSDGGGGGGGGSSHDDHGGSND